ncbi:UbiA prenyltransferase family protein [Candidatus Woesebacteria bacterium]|nr:UbiA prenyltransferase family protein [Candidatus Woesebacteria bacterium]
MKLIDHPLYLLLKTARPRQWIKNLSLYATLFFTGFLFYVPADGPSYFMVVSLAFIVFCFLTSSVYIINDIIDKDADKHHPFKNKRPIASGALPIPIALFGAGTALAIVFFLSIWLPFFFKLLVLAYLGLQWMYAKYLKHIPILDVVSIGTGFLIRVYAGAVVVNLHMSVWFLLTVISISLFLAVGKRQSERTLMSGKDATLMGNTRKILLRYSQRLLDQYTGMFATATWLTYAIFTFQNQIVTPTSAFSVLYTLLPKTLHTQKLLMLTLPFVILGVMRYLQLIHEKNEGESPERVLLGDKPLLGTVFLFGVVSFLVIYVIG